MSEAVVTHRCPKFDEGCGFERPGQCPQHRMIARRLVPYPAKPARPKKRKPKRTKAKVKVGPKKIVKAPAKRKRWQPPEEVLWSRPLSPQEVLPEPEVAVKEPSLEQRKQWLEEAFEIIESAPRPSCVCNYDYMLMPLEPGISVEVVCPMCGGVR